MASRVSLEAVRAVVGDDDEEGVRVVESLLAVGGQEHIFAAWPSAPSSASAPSSSPSASSPSSGEAARARGVVAQLKRLDKAYPGGVRAYVERARELLRDSAAGTNPFDGFTPEVPRGETIDPASTDELDGMEREGVREAARAAFVLVAGGLGERLGYDGIKVALPSETATGLCFLGLYAARILALQSRARAETGDASLVIPFVIMTSGDTHEKTVALLRENGSFGLADGQVTLLQQEKVPAVADAGGALAVDDPDRPTELLTKPHGHGDVHTLLHQAGLPARWRSEGRRWVFFFQDTNVVVFHAVPAALAVSARRNFAVNSLTVARRPGEAVGAICLLRRGDEALTINVEYNQLDPLLRATVSADGDVADPETGFSPYPGNCNVLVMQVDDYASTLERTGGSVPEFVNPKYADESRTAFKKPVRLECMMQDFPRLLPPESRGERVGFTQCERWMSFSAVKNSVDGAAAKERATGYAEGAAAGEADVYHLFRHILSQAPGVTIEAAVPAHVEYAGVRTAVGAKIVVAPSAGVTQREIRGIVLPGASVRITARSALVISGPGVRIRNLDLDGALVVRAGEGAEVEIRNLRVRNDGWRFVPVDQDDESVPQQLRIRGYRMEKRSQRELVFDKPGKYVVDEE